MRNWKRRDGEVITGENTWARARAVTTKDQEWPFITTRDKAWQREKRKRVQPGKNKSDKDWARVIKYQHEWQAWENGPGVTIHAKAWRSVTMWKEQPSTWHWTSVTKGDEAHWASASPSHLLRSARSPSISQRALLRACKLPFGCRSIFKEK
jgi:hypothetical protein